MSKELKQHTFNVQEELQEVKVEKVDNDELIKQYQRLNIKLDALLARIKARKANAGHS